MILHYDYGKQHYTEGYLWNAKYILQLSKLWVENLYGLLEINMGMILNN